MKLSTKDKKILLMFLGIVFVAVSYLFVYRPQIEEAEQIEMENIPLEERLSQLLEMAENREFYEQETREMQTKIQEYGRLFPADVRPEDGIVLARNMENSMDIQISNVSLGEKEFIVSLNGQTEGENTAQTFGEDFSPSLYRTQNTMQFRCTYDSLKRAVKYLSSQSGRMTLNSVNASFDSVTGNLTGTMTVNLFSMSGMDTSYTEPDAGSVSYGTSNIFGTIEAAQ